MQVIEAISRGYAPGHSMAILMHTKFLSIFNIRMHRPKNFRISATRTTCSAQLWIQQPTHQHATLNSSGSGDRISTLVGLVRGGQGTAPGGQTESSKQKASRPETLRTRIKSQSPYITGK